MNLQSKDFGAQKIIYKQHNLIVSKAKCLPLNIKVCIKTKKLSSNCSIQSILIESEILLKTQHLELTPKIYNCNIETTSSGQSVSTIMEYLPYTSLEDITKKNLTINSYHNLQSLIIKFIKYFKDLQNLNICHRNIKPEKICMNKQGEYKICGFSDGKLVGDSNEMTIRGTNNYLSPLLRSQYNLVMEQSSKFIAIHNPYKSDVYSLGLVFLYMATNKPIDRSFNDLERLENVIQSRLKEVTNIYVEHIISKMLQINEDDRPDFCELYEIAIELMNNRKCPFCWEKESSAESFCNKCEAYCHIRCLKDKYFCPACFKDLRCIGCDRFVGNKMICGDYFCEVCRIENTDCENCSGRNKVLSNEQDLKTLDYSRTEIESKIKSLALNE
ncbi:hypothetical protein SteCoe_271 [Stentor coeruleus]|uniref:Protein kinase domain-containing protein n=1 Tax=Stentor coeruleus TaxID=5963 RepID=A0A1R2D4A5_9CILI|nr:hypothetical protein SteCoe_271 [Stentor coeruleus]